MDEDYDGAVLLTALAVSPEARKLVRTCGFRTMRDLRRDPPVQLARELAMEPRKVAALVREIRDAARRGLEPTTTTTTTGTKASMLTSSTSTGAAASTITGQKRKGRTALELLARDEQEDHKIVTQCKAIDEMLGGGVSLGMLTEFCGVPGAGKTQVAMQLAVDVVIPQAFGGIGGDCLYVDTEGSLTIERLVGMAEAIIRQLNRIAQATAKAGDAHLYEKQKQALAGFNSVDAILGKIHVCRVHNLVEQLSVAHCITDMLRENPNIRLVIIDSVAFHFRQNMGENAGQRARVLSAHAGLLNALAAERNLAVVVTNQMTVKFDPAARANTTDAASTYYAPALGETWSHSVTNRVLLERVPEAQQTSDDPGGQQKVRMARLVKSSYLASGEASFVVGAAGVRDVPRRKPRAAAAAVHS